MEMFIYLLTDLKGWGRKLNYDASIVSMSGHIRESRNIMQLALVVATK